MSDAFWNLLSFLGIMVEALVIVVLFAAMLLIGYAVFHEEISSIKEDRDDSSDDE